MKWRVIPNEPRLQVDSESQLLGASPTGYMGPLVDEHTPNNYIVDLEWQEEAWHRPKLKCGCVRGLMGQDCIHLRLIRKMICRDSQTA